MGICDGHVLPKYLLEGCPNSGNSYTLMKRVLCFGDSNTWGFTPVTGERMAADVRWPGVMQQELEVAETGTYEFELRRWPREADTAIAAGMPAVDVTAGRLEEGVALPIKSARIQVGRGFQSKAVGKNDKSVTFTFDLEAGPTRLYTWFEKSPRQGILGAYHVYVNRL